MSGYLTATNEAGAGGFCILGESRIMDLQRPCLPIGGILAGGIAGNNPQPRGNQLGQIFKGGWVYKNVDVIFCWLYEDADSARKLWTLNPIGRIDDNEESLDHWVFTERYRPTDLMTWIKSEHHDKQLVIPEELERLFESDTKTAAPAPPVTPPPLEYTERSVEVDGGESDAGK
jgi:hypothetical protein